MCPPHQSAYVYWCPPVKEMFPWQGRENNLSTVGCVGNMSTVMKGGDGVFKLKTLFRCTVWNFLQLIDLRTFMRNCRDGIILIEIKEKIGLGWAVKVNK